MQKWNIYGGYIEHTWIREWNSLLLTRFFTNCRSSCLPSNRGDNFSSDSSRCRTPGRKNTLSHVGNGVASHCYVNLVSHATSVCICSFPPNCIMRACLYGYRSNPSLTSFGIFGGRHALQTCRETPPNLPAGPFYCRRAALGFLVRMRTLSLH